ncbi:hypothetical protein [Amycolatopsis alkalitolerans]|uniref:Uncharacterized protein n=1 Tax=Amycolatopsis alkalitolerans TaxID=2547244 RepID=A0A5C4LQP5_9PSEU|nr:hypothetical protein [Amycolatopsis alkalitolerans]TNC20900.1 hypothetical protein FG385_29905 [Amycolatopsis alkalitolerans]
MKCIAHNVEYCQTCNTTPAFEPFRASFEGWTANPDSLDDWPNTVTVEAVTGYDSPAEEAASAAGELDLDEYADAAGGLELVEIDTNYKATRPGQHPVRLTRTDAARLAAAILEATEDTFHYTRCGRLRPADAKELLAAIREVEHQLSELRDHALTDLLIVTGLDTDWMQDVVDNARAGKAEQHEEAAAEGRHPATEAGQGAGPETPVPAWRGSWPADTSSFDTQFADALHELYPDAVSVFAKAAALGALAYKVNRRCQETGETPLHVLTSLDPGDRAFALNANDPAAFLASRIEN